MATRAKVGRGRRGKKVNLFAGLLIDAVGGGSMTYRTSGGYPANLVPVAAVRGRGGSWAAFPAAAFDAAILNQLADPPSATSGTG